MTLLLVIGQWSFAQGTKREKPNIILILADDYGYMDIQEYAKHTLGTDKSKMFYETPNLDRLIREGVAFDRAYATMLCAPTRSSILTGKYAARLGFTTATPYEPTYYNQGLKVPKGSYINDVIYHSDKIPIEQALRNGSSNTGVPSGTKYDNGVDETSIAEALPDYNSVFIGKWHMGGHGAQGYTPANQGFKSIAWYDAGSSPYFNWRKLWNNKSMKRHPNMPQKEWMIGNAGEETGENYLTDDLTVQALRFLNKQAKVKEKPFFLYFCHFAVHGPWQGKKEDIEHFKNKKTKGWNGQGDARYAAMIYDMDKSVGEILDKLEETGLDKNTLVIFMSDNGGIDNDVNPQGFITNNDPLKGGKACLTEGGVRVPLIFRWKGKIKEGKWSKIAVGCTDILPTIVEVAGYNPKSLYTKEDIDGRSIWGLMSDVKNKKKTYTRNTHYWHYPFNVIYNNPYDGLPLTPHSAIMEGNYKLIFDWYGKLKLFDVKKDLSENNNLAKKMPDKVNDLFGKLITWLDKDVKKTYWPTLNPDYNSAKEVRDVPFIDLVKIYRNGGDVAKAAN